MVAPKPQSVKMYQVKEKLLRPSLTSTFQCYIPPTGISEADQYNDTELLSLSCYETNLPGSSLMSHEATDDRTGITETFAYRKQYDRQIDLNFYVDHKDTQGYKVILFFESWIRYITNDNNQNDQDNFSYRVKYPRDYRKSLYLTKFERDFKGDLLVYKFLQAFPIAMSSMPVSYNNAEILKCRVTFNYDRYILNRDNQFIESEPSQSLPKGIDDLVRLQQERERELIPYNIIGGGDIPLPGNAPDTAIRKSQALSQQQIRNARLGL